MSQILTNALAGYLGPSTNLSGYPTNSLLKNPFLLQL